MFLFLPRTLLMAAFYFVFAFGQSFQIHKQLGTYGKFLVPLHVAGAFTHYFRGHTIFSRVNPFATRPKY